MNVETHLLELCDKLEAFALLTKRLMMFVAVSGISLSDIIERCGMICLNEILQAIVAPEGNGEIVKNLWAIGVNPQFLLKGDACIYSELGKYCLRREEPYQTSTIASDTEIEAIVEVW